MSKIDPLQEARNLIINALRIEHIPDEPLSRDSVIEWDSVGHMQLILKIESSISRNLDFEEVERLYSEVEVAEIIRKYPGGSSA